MAILFHCIGGLVLRSILLNFCRDSWESLEVVVLFFFFFLVVLASMIAA